MREPKYELFHTDPKCAVILTADLLRMSAALVTIADEGCDTTESDCRVIYKDPAAWCHACIAAYGLGRIQP